MRVCVRLILCVRAVRDVGRHRGRARRSLTTGPIGLNGPREGDGARGARDRRSGRAMGAMGGGR